MPYLPEDPHDSRLPVAFTLLFASNHARSDARSLPMGYPAAAEVTPAAPPRARTLARHSTTSG